MPTMPAAADSPGPADGASPRMAAADVLFLRDRFRREGIPFWVDGGWGVDALLGRQTRPHADLDVVLLRHDRERFVATLAGLGYRPVKLAEARPHNFVMGDGAGREVDLHVVWFDAAGRGRYDADPEGEHYPAGSLAGHGAIAGQPVRCVAPAAMVAFHTGYPLQPKDLADVAALCAAFGLPLPEEHARAARARGPIRPTTCSPW